MKTETTEVTDTNSNFIMEYFSNNYQSPELASIDMEDITIYKMPEKQYATQIRYFEDRHPNAEIFNINHKKVRIGKVIISNEFTYHIIDISILKKYQNKGVGSHVLESIKANAVKLNKSVTLTVALNNPAINLFRRLGFKDVLKDRFHLKMCI